VANLLFYALSVVAVLAGIGVIVSRSPVVSVLSLLAAFLAMAVLYLLTGFQVIAALQVLVYAGAIMVLFLFVVMLLNLGDPAEALYHEPLFHHGGRKTLGVGIAFALLVAVGAGVLGSSFSPPPSDLPPGGIDSVKGLASWMFVGRHALAFEAVSVLLLATAVGVLALAKRERPGTTAGTGSEESRS
jgi:NADH-quinone oxidoreductase subunit J